MAKFIAVVRQSGGCDYTIRCGTDVIHLDAKDKPSAFVEVEALLRGDEDNGRPYSDERELDSMTIYEVSQKITVDVKGIYKKISEEDKAAQALEERASKKKLLKKLKEELGE